MAPDPTRILILGGGFAGVYAALHLERIFARDPNVEITLVSEENFLLFTPMLPEVASSSIEAKHIISPIRAFFGKVKFQNSVVQSIDLEKRLVVASHCPICQVRVLEFQHLILALGSTSNFHGLPGVAENALPMKTLSDAMALRNHVIDVFEHADLQSDPEIRKAMLTFVVAGGGFAGAETVAELRDFAFTARRYYSNVRTEEVRVVLVHGGPRIMPEISESLAGYALRKLRTMGVEVRLDTRIRSVAAAWVELSTGERIPTSTLVWTAGVAPSPLLDTLPCQRSTHGQIMVNEYLEAPGYPGVWAAGDCAEVPDPRTGRPYPPTAQHAIRQGKILAGNVAAVVRGGAKKPLAYRPLGMLACLGKRSAVAEICGLRFSGFFAWWLWRTIYLFKLPGLERKVRVAMDWTLDLFFPRDIVLLKSFHRKG
ncbi:MAG: NAD(P)/FAD-dependent oxidoreductase [Acidobacteria bacterium]|nr:NAD(P)/FAD-dependent oxidoreductase [Acidobacteriota bacterium]